MSGRQLRSLATAAMGLLGACQASGEPPPERPATLRAAASETAVDEQPAAAPEVDWAAARGCLGNLRLLHGRAGEDLGPPERIPVAVLVPPADGPRAWLEPTPGLVEPDLPLAIHVRGDGRPPGAPCIIEIGRARDLEAERRVVGREVVASRYQSGSVSEKNPEYDAAEAKVRQAERRLKERDAGLITVGDPMLDLVGLMVGGMLAGFKDFGEEQELDEALETLASTPRTLVRAKYQAYHFERTTVHARKAATVPVALLERGLGPVRQVVLRQSEARAFQLLDGLDPRDPDYDEHRAASVSEHELEQWSETPPRLRLSTVVAALAEWEGSLVEEGSGATRRTVRRLEPDAPDPAETSRPGPRAAADPDGAAASAAAGAGSSRASAAPAPRAGDRRASLVRVGGEGGSGVFVRPHLVLSAARLLGDSSVLDVVTGDARTLPGLVLAADPASGLALIHVPRAAPPLGLADAAGTEPGLVLNHRGQARRLSASRGGEGRTVQVDGSFVGAPVLQGDRVAGILIDPGGEGYPPDVAGVDAIVDFLEAHAVALAARP